MAQQKSLLNELRMVHIAMQRTMRALCECGGGSCLPALSAMMVHFIFMRGGSALQKDVENEFGLRRSTVSRQLHKLEQDGYILRTAAERDGRSKRITLSEKAMAEQDEIAAKFGVVETHVEKALSPVEKETFHRLCGKIRARLEKADGGDAPQS